MLKIGSRKRRCSAEGSFQLFEKDFLLGEPGVYRANDLPGEEADSTGRPTTMSRSSGSKLGTDADAEAMTAAAASHEIVDPRSTGEAVKTVSRNEPRKVQGSVARPVISIAAMAIPAGGKIGDA